MSTNPAHHRRLLLRVWARNIHIYISMLGLLAVMFFSVTGIMLNHSDWFDLNDPRVTKMEGTLPAAMLKGPDKLAVVEKLRKDFGATGALDSFDVDDSSLEVVFKSPGRRTEANIDRQSGHADVTVESHGFGGRIAELHRGTDAGPAWRLVGIAALAVCLGACLIIYFVFVP
jgi:hypothetical protein